MGVGKTVVFDGKMGMRKFGSAAPPFGKVAYAVKVFKGTVKPRFNVILVHRSSTVYRSIARNS